MLPGLLMLVFTSPLTWTGSVILVQKKYISNNHHCSPWFRTPYKAHHCWKQQLSGGVEGALTRMRTGPKASSNSNSVRSAVASRPLKSSNMPFRLPVRSRIKLTSTSSPNFMVYVGKHWNELYCSTVSGRLDFLFRSQHFSSLVDFQLCPWPKRISNLIQ